MKSRPGTRWRVSAAWCGRRAPSGCWSASAAVGRRDPAGAGVENPVDLGLRERHRLRAGADEARHARRVLHDHPGVVVQVHVDEHVAREDALLRRDLLTVLGLDHLLGRHDDSAKRGCWFIESIRCSRFVLTLFS